MLMVNDFVEMENGAQDRLIFRHVTRSRGKVGTQNEKSEMKIQKGRGLLPLKLHFSNL